MFQRILKFPLIGKGTKRFEIRFCGPFPLLFFDFFLNLPKTLLYTLKCFVAICKLANKNTEVLICYEERLDGNKPVLKKQSFEVLV